MTDLSQSELNHELKARFDIQDALIRYCRGVDRCDLALTVSAYHSDAWDEHGSFSGTAKDFAEWAINMHLTSFVWTIHNLSNVYIELDGDRANVESSVQATLRYQQDGTLFDLIGCGRYLDRFERRDGEWRIARRLVTGDWDRIEEVKAQMEGDLVAKLTRGTRDKSDPSYEYMRTYS